MLSTENFPLLKKSPSNDNLIQKPIVLKYSDVLKQKKTNVTNSLKFSEVVEKESKNDTKTDLLIKTISEKTGKLAIDNSKSPIDSNSKLQTEKNTNKDSNNTTEIVNKTDLHNKYKNSIDKIIKIQTWWRMVSKIKSVKKIEKNKVDSKENKKETEKKEIPPKKKLPKKPSFSDIVKLSPPAPTTKQPEQSTANSNTKNQKKVKKTGTQDKNPNENDKNNNKNNANEKKNVVKNRKVNEELNSILKNMKFMGLIEKEIDDLTEKNTIVNGKQFAKTKVVTIKKFSRTNSSSSSFSVDDVIEKDNNKKKNNKNENKPSNKKRIKKNVSFNEKDEVFNEYNHVMKKLDLHLRCDKKSCLIDCYRRLYKRDWEDEVSEESSSNSGISESEENIETTTPIKKSDYLYNDIYNPNYTKYYSGSDYDFGNRYFTGKERLKKALHLEPVEVTVQKIIYQPMKFQKNNRRNNQQKKKNVNKRKQK
ncbi:hypothetical protein PIROE2DRAFT_5611 [Piromyces sp. E2]|nr:hypothetical protein PIROE2DRAFT_5611 [Piromyces sp. E2]|eukprot:OUM67007.1 hypothetical protein PIROE2DRAFT_5611 [Piromyces sp. E2]